MKNVKSIKVGQIVAIPTYIVHPTRQGINAYEIENGIITQIGKNKKGESVAKVKYWIHNYGKIIEEIFNIKSIYYPCFYHMVDEEQTFKKQMNLL